MRTWRFALGMLAVTLTAGCGAAPDVPVSKVAMAAPAPSATQPTSKPAMPAVQPKMPEPGPPLPPLTYEHKGRRDPFTAVPVAKEKAGLDVATTRMVGVIQGQQLLALVEAPDGLGYILKPGNVLGNGRVTDVTANSVTFALAGQAGQRENSLTLRLARE